MTIRDSSQFYQLEPHLILDAAEANGFKVTGELVQLNSYENRVFDIKLENDQSIIGKFYRPGRWSQQTLLDEHHFTTELKSEGISVADVLKLNNQSTVDKVGDIYFCFFEKVRGRLVQELTDIHFKKLGHWLARLHNVGSKKTAEHRAYMGPTSDNKWDELEQMIQTVSPELVNRYADAAFYIFEKLDDYLQNTNFIRIHGDLHRGNILENSTKDFVVIDFDDMINGPEIQDFWMLLPDSDLTYSKELDLLIESYSELREFPEEQLNLIPLLRGYRIINYAIWIKNRWSDPSFPRLFPDFGTYRYWAEETENLEKIIYLLQ